MKTGAVAEREGEIQHRAARDTQRPLRVCIVAPSLAILGGQAIVAQRLIERLRMDPSLEISFVPHNPTLPGPLRYLQRIKYVRTIVTSLAYVACSSPAADSDVVHVFSASYWSFLLAPTPAVLIARLYGKRVILSYRSGEALDHLRTWSRTALPILRMADSIVVPSGYLVDVFSQFGLRAESIGNFVDVNAFHIACAALRPIFSPIGISRRFTTSLRAARICRDSTKFRTRSSSSPAMETNAPSFTRCQRSSTQHVEFLGQVPPSAMPALYDRADVYLNAPNIDNIPNSIIESFAAGLPVVTTRAGRHSVHRHTR
jgi:glycosyltransferase involved in cell wall biosynthesis